jgi:hypothetical protein
MTDLIYYGLPSQYQYRLRSMLTNQYWKQSHVHNHH